MAITPSWITNKEGEEEYVDKGAVMMPQINPVTDARYVAAKIKADAKDFVQWPTAVHGQENQGM